MLLPASDVKKRKAITLEMKLKIISLHESGKSVMAITCELGLSQLMISTTLKDKRIGDAVKLSALVKSTVFSKKLPGLIDDMGNFLDTRMEDQIQRRTRRSLLRQVFSICLRSMLTILHIRECL